jgi:hypothetical protein
MSNENVTVKTVDNEYKRTALMTRGFSRWWNTVKWGADCVQTSTVQPRINTPTPWERSRFGVVFSKITLLLLQYYSYCFVRAHGGWTGHPTRELLLLPSGAMSRGQDPLFGYQHTGAVEYLVRAAEDCCQEWPVARQWRSSAHYPRLPVHGLRSSSHSTFWKKNYYNTQSEF